MKTAGQRDGPRRALVLAGAVGLGWGVQALFTEWGYGRLTGRSAPGATDLGPLWTPYCVPSDAMLLRAARWPDLGGWLFESAGDLLCLGIAIGALQVWLVGPSLRALRLVRGELGLSLRGLLAGVAAVLLFDLALLLSPRNVVLWEVADDLGRLAAIGLVAHVVHGCIFRRRPDWLSPARMDWLLAVGAGALAMVLLFGGFATAWLPTSWGTVGPRWPALAFVVALDWWLRTRVRQRSPAATGTTPMRQKLALAGVALVLVLGLAEVGARVLLSQTSYDVQAAEAQPAAEPRKPIADVKSPEMAIELSRIVRPSRNPRLVYELRPRQKDAITLPFLATTRFRTNSFGMRGSEIALEKPSGTIRIAGLGDSVMFGWGVPYRETHLHVLGQLLQARDPHRRYETLNFGVPGYNTVMERESFVELARRFSPDLVLLTVVKNDADLPNFLQRPRNPLCLHRAFFSGLLRRVTLGADPYAAHEILVAQSFDFERGHFTHEDGRTPVGSERLSGTRNALAALRRLQQDVRAIGAQLVIAFDYDDVEAELEPTDIRIAVLEAAREWGIPVVDPREALVAYLRENDLRSTDLWVSAHDSHPSPARHRITAELLAERVPELLEPRER